MNDNSDRKISQADVLRIIDEHLVISVVTDIPFIPSGRLEAMIKEIEEL